MLVTAKSFLETRNYVDNLNFTANDPAIFVTYPPGASGDLLISIIDKHYIRTGCEYYGISETGKVVFYPSDYKSIGKNIILKKPLFDEQWFLNFSENLSKRHLNYSLLDMVIFGCHLYKIEDTKLILSKFPNAKIINVKPLDHYGGQLIQFLRYFKNHSTELDILKITHDIENEFLHHERVLNLPFGSLFNKKSYIEIYDQIIKFLNLEGRLIDYDYVKYYLSKQHPKIKNLLIDYSQQYV